MHKDWIAILDFGSQYTHLIARRVREYGVYSEIVTNDVSARALSVRVPKAIILSGGPASVVSGKSLICDKDIFNMGVPILGICYGAQLMVKMLGGRVVKAKAGEYGKAILAAPQDPSNYIASARLNIYTGNYEQAIENASNAMLLDQNSSMGAALEGFAHGLQGNYLEKFLELSSNGYLK